MSSGAAVPPPAWPRPAHLPDMTFSSADHPRAMSGRFVAVARAESQVELRDEAQVASDLYDIADQLAFTTQMTDDDKANSARRAMDVLGHLPDAEQHWDAIRTAVERWSYFEDEDSGDLRAGETLTPDLTLDVDIEDFAGYNEADRAGECGYMGYDFRGYADALADAWREELTRRTRAAAQAALVQVERRQAS